MQKYVLWTLAAALVPLFVGCSQYPQTVRGQSPDGNPAGGMYCPPGGACPTDCRYGCPGLYDTMPNYPRLKCDSLCNPYPGHVGYKMTYKEPNCLVYPPANDQPATVQYPYYTLKGPDCFFEPPLGR